MRRPVILLTSALLSSAVVASPLLTTSAAAAPGGLIPLESLGCGLGAQVCELAGEVTTLLAPLDSVLDPLIGEGTPLPIPAVPGLPELSPEPSTSSPDSPAASPGAAPTKVTGNAAAPAVSSPTGVASAADARRAVELADARPMAAAVPNVSTGSGLNLTALDQPQVESTPSPLASGTDAVDELASDQLGAPAVSAAITDLPSDSRTAVVVLAIGTLMLAAGLLLDQVRRARQPLI